jgi:hypothetical protein
VCRSMTACSIYPAVPHSNSSRLKMPVLALSRAMPELWMEGE